MVIYDKAAVAPNTIGTKAAKLQELVTANFSVPPFVVISTDEVRALIGEENEVLRNNLLAELVSETMVVLKTKLFAVRSATLIEDGDKNSHAGQFSTKLRVNENNLPLAIWQIIQDSLKKVSADKISVIVQEFIEADYAGVIFSRNPNGGREMVLEYNAGIGESVVGGQVVKQISFLYGQEKLLVQAPMFVAKLAQLTAAIEAKYNWPQDIEWAVKAGVIYILQTRPITSIVINQWEGLQYLDIVLRDQKAYYYKQTDIAETFDKPKTLAFSIIKRLYAPQGPIEKTYQKLHLRYEATNQLQLFGNELYVDKIAELKAIFPALGHLKHSNVNPKLERLSKLIVTVWNWSCLTLMSSKSKVGLQIEVARLLGEEWSESVLLKDRWAFILKQYQIIFEINIRAQKAAHTLERLLGADAHLMLSILNCSPNKTLQTINHQGLVGNSFNVDDTSAFVVGLSESSDKDNQNQIDDWLQTLPTWRRQGLLPYIESVKQYNTLREQTRILSVKLISYLRRAVITIGENKYINEPELVYFSEMEELINGTTSREKCFERKEKYDTQQNLLFPKVITSFQVERLSTSSAGISPGIGRGSLVTADMIENTTDSKILYTKILSPDLVKYFPQIEGIVSEEGGLLSHLAIIAREKKIPVVVTNQKLEVGTKIEIDGVTGKILNFS